MRFAQLKSVAHNIADSLASASKVVRAVAPWIDTWAVQVGWCGP